VLHPSGFFYQKSTGKYCRERKLSGKRIYEELVPQPPAVSVVTITRYYNVLKADASYRRRITWLTSGGVVSPVAVIEYIGKHVAGSAHGNCRAPGDCDNYVRTPAETMEEAVDKLMKQVPSKAVYTTLVNELGVLDAPRDSNVVYSKKSRANKEAKHNGCANFASNGCPYTI